MKLSTKIIIGILIAAALAGAFFLGGEPAMPKEETSPSVKTVEKTKQAEKADEAEAPEKTEPEREITQPSSPSEKPKAVSEVKKEEPPYCTLSVRCDTALQSKSLSSETASIIPDSGVIFAENTVNFKEGESVFDVLLREMKNNGIHMEFSVTPVYKSAYVEGIGNLYELDCGELSGWMYKVNGVFPNYGASKYILKSGDKIEWVYTCDLGNDVGGGYAGGQKDE